MRVMKKSVKTIIILIIILVLGILIYRSPDEAYWLWLKENPQDAIEIGRTYAYYLLNSHKEGLLKMSVNPAKAKIENSNFRRIALVDMHNQLEKKQILMDITDPFFASESNQEMELITLEKLRTFIVMTFAYKCWDKIVEIPDKGKLLFSVAVRYHNPRDNRLVPKLIRKVANLPLLRNFTGRMGTTRRWVVFDYNYRYNFNDYFEWVLKEGESYSQKQLEGSEEFMKQLASVESLEKYKKFIKEIEESTHRMIYFLYEWGSIAVGKQIYHMDRLYKKAEQELEKNSQLETE